jgi:2-iminobutanoate/2-iminopropanoate deaminase
MMRRIFYSIKTKNFINKMNSNNPKIQIDSLDSSKTPQAIGPYSKGTRVDMGDKYMIFTSGSLGVDPQSGNLVSDEVVGQTRQALDNLKNLLEY